MLDQNRNKDPGYLDSLLVMKDLKIFNICSPCSDSPCHGFDFYAKIMRFFLYVYSFVEYIGTHCIKSEQCSYVTSQVHLYRVDKNPVLSLHIVQCNSRITHQILKAPPNFRQIGKTRGAHPYKN